MNPIFGLMFRHLLTSFGGGFVAAGLLTASQWEAIGGGIAALVGVVLSWREKQAHPRT